MRQLTLDKLAELSLKGMRRALEAQLENPRTHELSFEDRLLLLLDAEELSRMERSLEYRLRAAGLKQTTSNPAISIGSVTISPQDSQPVAATRKASSVEDQTSALRKLLPICIL